MAREDGLQVDGPVAASAGVLPDRPELALIAVERTRMPMVVADATASDWPIVLANRAFLDLTGYEAVDVLGRNCRFLQGPGTAPEAIRRLREGLAREETFDVELLNYRKDGTTFVNAVHLSPVRDAAGRLTYYFGSQWDVTARKSAEALRAAEHRLLREVDHRAMNALALVLGFVRLGRRDSIEAFAGGVEGRVAVLARAHAMLAKTRWADVTLDHILQGELGPRAGDQARIEGPVVRVAADRVQPLALLLHELASNAARHGALARPEGRVEISWRLGAAPGLVDLTWRERGAPAEAPAAAGLGLRLASAIAQKQLQGGLRQHWGEEGLTTDVSCRVAAVAP